MNTLGLLEQLLDEAIHNKDVENVKLRIHQGAKMIVDPSSLQSPLHKSAKVRSAAITRILIESGCNAALLDTYGKTALQIAIRNQDSEVALLLLDQPCCGENETSTALHEAAAHCFDDEKLVCALLENPYIRQSLTKDFDESPLQRAAKCDNYLVASCILAIEPHEMDCMDKAARTAAINGAEKVLELLISKGVDVFATPKHGSSIINLARRNGHVNLAKKCKEMFQHHRAQLEKELVNTWHGIQCSHHS